MPQIRMPDGQVVAFPDDMPRQQIQAMVFQRYPELDTGRSQRVQNRAQEIYAGMQAGENDPPMTGQEKWADTVHSVGSGANTFVGGLAGLPGTIQGLVDEGAKAIGRGVTGQSRIEQEAYLNNTENRGMDLIPQLPTMSDVWGKMEEVAPGSVNYEPKLRANKFTKNVMSFGPGGPVGWLRGALAPGVLSEGARQLFEGTPMELPAYLAGALMSPLALRAAGRSISPFAAAPNDTKAARLLEREGIPLTAGQRTKSKTLRFVEEELGGKSLDDMGSRQADAFTNRMLRFADPVTKHTRADADAMVEIGDRLSDTFKALGKRNVVVPDRQLSADLGSAFREYMSNTAASTRVPAVRELLADIVTFGSGRVPAERYQNLRSKIERLRRSATDPQLKQVYSAFRSAVDDVMDRSIAATNPSDIGAYRQAREGYRAFLSIEDAASRAGSASAEGVLTPQAMASALKKSRGKRSWTRSASDMERITRAMNELAYPLNNSNTAARLAARGLIHSPLTIAGGIAGYNESGGGIEGAIGGLAGAAAGRLANRALGRAILSRPVRAYLSNQVGAPLANGPGIFGTLRRTAGGRP